MKYVIVDEASAKQEALRNQALQAEQVAYQHEMTALEQTELALRWPREYAASAEIFKNESARLRAEADALLKASNLTNEEVIAAHLEFLQNWLGSLEQTHAGHVAVQEARQAAGLDPNPEQSKIIDQVEVSHKLARGILDSFVDSGTRKAKKKG